MNSTLHRSLQVQRRLLIGLLTLAALRAGSAFLGFAPTPDAEIIHGRRFEVLDVNGVDYGSLGMLQQMRNEVILGISHPKVHDMHISMFEHALTLGGSFRRCDLALFHLQSVLRFDFDIVHVDVAPWGPDLDMQLRVGESQARWQLWNSMPPPNQKLKIKRGDSESALGEDGANPPFTIDPQRGPLPAVPKDAP